MSSVSACELTELPVWVLQAGDVEWGVKVDAYLVGAARVGNRYTALVYRDLAGASRDGMTVITPEVRAIAQKSGYTLLRSFLGGSEDHYVIASELKVRMAEAT